MKAVVKNILDHWENRSVQGRYSALLTTHVRRGTSTPMAMKYFEEFIKQNKQREARGLKPLTVAVTFSFANNNENTQKKNNADLKRATDVYDEEFGTNFHEDSVKEYFADVVARLSGDDPGTGNDSARRLNLVIVVDQLLTGFDALTLNTLYVDRTLSGASLIQAYSRTNRIEDNQYKPFGRIVNFRYPETSKELMNDALRLYANSSSAVIKNDQSSSLSDMSDAPLTDVIARPWNDVVEDTKQIIERLRTLTKDFTDLNPTDETVRKQSLNLCAAFNKNLSILKQDENFDYAHPEQLKKQLGITDEDKKIKSIEFIITDQTQSGSDHDDPTKPVDSQPALDLDFHVEHIGEERVDYPYLQKLLADYLNAQSNHEPNSEARLANLQDAAGQYEDRQQAHRLMDLASVAQNSESGKIPGVDYPIKVDDIPRLVDKNNKDQARRQILQFRTKWGLNDIDNAKRIIDDLIRNHSPHADDLKGQELNALLEAVTRQRLYPTDAQDDTIKNMSVFRYRSALTHALQELADSIVEQTPNFDNSDQAN